MSKAKTIALLFTAFFCLGTTCKVTRVIDGDTFETETGEKVRLIGINAPEISDVFGQEAKQHLINLIENRTVFLQVDNVSNNRDRYQRLLRYVICDEIDINETMVSDGFAFAYLKYKFSKSSEYENAQLESRENNRGIWGDSKTPAKSNKQKKILTIFGKNITRRVQALGSLVLLLLLVGLYAYVKK